MIKEFRALNIFLFSHCPINKTQKRANALKNIMIPKFETQIKSITEALEEKEREEFSRLKVIKNQSK